MERTAGARWNFRPRPQFMLGLASFLWLLSAASFWSSGKIGLLPPGAALYLSFLGTLGLLTGALLLLVALVQQKRAVTLHPPSSTFILKKRMVQSAYRVVVRETQVSGLTLVSLWAVLENGTEILLVPGTFESARGRLEQLATSLRREGEVESDDELSPPRKIDLEGWIGVVFGLLWSVVGYLWAPHLLWEISDGYGVLVWPFGLFVLSMGILELAGIPIIRAGRKNNPIVLIGVLLLAVYAGLSLVAL